VNPARPVISNTIFDVKNYGAAGDGVTTDTKAVQAAINAAGAAGGGIVEIPAGIYLCGPLQPASQINLRVDKGATLRMLPLNQYPGGIKTRRILSAVKICMMSPSAAWARLTVRAPIGGTWPKPHKMPSARA
jgi:hypothetical protein